ncbi:unnamed protein product [Musa acuminata subsp. malaccensis]|uniref:(wild Malaysian banana) hypothetical protein n=1 Tax=Musa acuminata subsp. malaccensis TaxID=214687 RepID=A0A804J169_MUSAM|nr:unnamed protein product [Musa acuminata subsp. malaccensis]
MHLFRKLHELLRYLDDAKYEFEARIVQKKWSYCCPIGSNSSQVQLERLRRSLPCCIPLFKGFLRFYGVIQESMVSRNNSSPKLASASDSSMPHSSIGVSDAACLSYKKTDDKTARPQVIYHHNSLAGNR